jgi:hypothetical protein
MPKKKTPWRFPLLGVREGACPLASWTTNKKTPWRFPLFGVREGGLPPRIVDD